MYLHIHLAQYFMTFVQEFEEESIRMEEQERDDMTFFYAPRSPQGDVTSPTRLCNDQVLPCVAVS